jgi:hypothetical protein
VLLARRSGRRGVAAGCAVRDAHDHQLLSFGC